MKRAARSVNAASDQADAAAIRRQRATVSRGLLRRRVAGRAVGVAVTYQDNRRGGARNKEKRS